MFFAGNNLSNSAVIYDFSKSLQTALIRQDLYQNEIQDIPGAVNSSLMNFSFDQIQPGQKVAIAVGSRGIDRIAEIMTTLVDFLKGKKLRPVIVPAMGSHGGADEKGQRAVLFKLGITESSVDAPVDGDMSVIAAGELKESGLKIYMGKKAFEADWIIPVNRIKPHTKFNGPVESGLCKMLTIGLGKTKGAREFHRQAVRHGFGIIGEAASAVLQLNKVLFGLALVEDGCGKLSCMEALSSQDLIEKEKVLLKEAYANMAKIPLNNIDILIVDRIGKDISGIGMDSNVTGRHRDITGNFFTAPHVKRIFVRELSPDSDGNANGIGLADVTTSRLVKQMDMKKTRINAITAISPEKAAIPVHFDSDLECLHACAATAGIKSLVHARVVRIIDTKHLEYFQASRAFEKEILSDGKLKITSGWKSFDFDNHGNMKKMPVK